MLRQDRVIWRGAVRKSKAAADTHPFPLQKASQELAREALRVRHRTPKGDSFIADRQATRNLRLLLIPQVPVNGGQRSTATRSGCCLDQQLEGRKSKGSRLNPCLLSWIKTRP